MEEAAVLYSGGKDSSLAAYMLSSYYDVKLVTISFGVLDSWKHASRAAEVLGFDHKVKKFKRDIAEKALEMIINDGFPKNGIDFIHKNALCALAEEYGVIADGTRREDRAPCLNLGDIRSLEDKYAVEYIAPLRGMGYKTIRKLAESIFKIEKKSSAAQKNSDYESELRAIAEGKRSLAKVFPNHMQSVVVGYCASEVR